MAVIKRSPHLKKPQIWKFGLLLLLLVLFASYATKAQTSPQETEAAPPSWLESRGLNIVNLVGLVPDSHLQGVRMVFDIGRGSVTYLSGTRANGEIKVQVAINSKDPNRVYCLGAKPILDHGFNVAPSSTMRVFKNNGATEITGDLQSSFELWPAEYVRPSTSADGYPRYQSQTSTKSVNGTGAVEVPANMGCYYTLNGANGPYTDVTAEFTMAATNNIKVTQVWHHENNGVSSYIGGGYAGNLAGLQTQMQDYHNSLTKDDQRLTHDSIVSYFDHEKAGTARLSDEARQAISTESDYFLVNYPPAWDPASTTPSYNASGTVRARYNNGSAYKLSVDYFNGMLLPRAMHWVDGDLETNAQFLTQFEALYERGGPIWETFDEITAPELFLPPGIDYQQCMTDGNCPTSLIKQIYDHTYTVNTYFYKIEAYKSNTEQVCLRSVGKQYTPVARTAYANKVNEVATDNNVIVENANFSNSIFLPMLSTPLQLQIIGANPQCPRASGIFDAEGQMLDYYADPIVYAAP